MIQIQFVDDETGEILEDQGNVIVSRIKLTFAEEKLDWVDEELNRETYFVIRGCLRDLSERQKARFEYAVLNKETPDIWLRFLQLAFPIDYEGTGVAVPMDRLDGFKEETEPAVAA